MRHAEAGANAVVGIAVAQFVLWMSGVQFSSAIALNLTLFMTSYVRSLVLRIVFNRIAISFKE